jgi:hypothetical protein
LIELEMICWNDDHPRTEMTGRDIYRKRSMIGNNMFLLLNAGNLGGVA